MSHKFIYADAQKCIGCLNCELACAASHMGITLEKAYELGQSGIKLVSRNRVIKSGELTAPMQCTQCIDAPCVNACPIDIIKYEDNYVKYYEDDCIGCQSCEMVCPYGAVVMAPNEKDDAPVSKMVALTCDLCGGEDGKQACVNVCPTDAISLIDYDLYKAIEYGRELEGRHANA